MAGALSVALTWSLNETADGFYKISKDIVHAATTDGVQATALDALDKFGATLAICPDTEYQVEQGLRKAQGSRVVEFMKSRIGFMPGDSCTALSKSTGGIRFLSLAATLVTWDHFEAAKATREMMEASAKRNENLPTLGNLVAIYEALEYKTTRLGFADNLVEWHIRIVNQVRKLLDQQYGDPLFQLLGMLNSPYSQTCPSAGFISRLVTALREVFRLGSGEHIKISVGYSIIWTISFVHWCIGICPTIVLCQSGQVICEDPQVESRVEIRILDAEGKESINMFTPLDGPTSLWESESISVVGAQEWAGMVTVSTFGKRFIQECDLDTAQGHYALHQTLLHSTMAAMLKIQPLSAEYRNPRTGEKKQDKQPGRLSVPSTSNLHFSLKRISSTLIEYLGSQDYAEHQLKQLEEGQEINDVPDVKQYRDTLKARCGCSSCSDNANYFGECSVLKFERHTVCITAHILVLSFFGLTEPVKMYSSISNRMLGVSSHAELIMKLTILLFPNSKLRNKGWVKGQHTGKLHGKDLASDPIVFFDIWEFGLRMIGHRESSQGNVRIDMIASSNRGQVVYPHFFASRSLDMRSILLIDGGPGVIIHKDERYCDVYGGHSLLAARNRISSDEQKSRLDGPVVRPRNLLEPPDMRLKWQVNKRLLFYTSGG